jgi:DNA-binding MarR family transcriptional regulator
MTTKPAEATLLAALRDVAVQFGRLNQRVGLSLDLTGVDLESLDLIGRTGPTTPSAVAAALGVHPATMTGIVDRLERGGWVSREPDPADRRRVIVTALRTRAGELVRGYRPMSTAMHDLLGDYTEEQIDLLTEFLRNTAHAARQSIEHVDHDPTEPAPGRAATDS